MNDHFRSAPAHILKKLAIILLAKAYHVKVSKEIRVPYNNYVEALRKTLPEKKYNRLDSYTASGEYHNLSSWFQQLNELYFENNLKKPILGWSRNKSYWRLGFYDRERNLLVISRIFDQPRVPAKPKKLLSKSWNPHRGGT